MVVPTNGVAIAELDPVRLGCGRRRCRCDSAGKAIEVGEVRRRVEVLEDSVGIQPDVRLALITDDLDFTGGRANQLHSIAEFDGTHLDARSIALEAGHLDAIVAARATVAPVGADGLCRGEDRRRKEPRPEQFPVHRRKGIGSPELSPVSGLSKSGLQAGDPWQGDGRQGDRRQGGRGAAP